MAPAPSRGYWVTKVCMTEKAAMLPVTLAIFQLVVLSTQ